eukprot:4932828-Amphidinium_carterae.1
MVRLQSTQVPAVTFVVATYHVPNWYGELRFRRAKAIHLALLRHNVMNFAGEADFVLAGDINTQPEEAELNVLIEGCIRPEGVDILPPDINGLTIQRWMDGSAPSHKLRSAYKDVLQSEPTYTNFAWITGELQPFEGTLDYLLVSKG